MKKVLVLDFGGQYNLLVARRVRECGVYCEIKPYTMSMDDIRAFGPAAIIFTGGPATVFEPNAPALDNAIFELGLPILGICYGQQLMIHQLGGACRRAEVREYGKVELTHDGTSLLFDGDDLLVLARSGDCRAKTLHDGNLITLHRVRNFRERAK